MSGSQTDRIRELETENQVLLEMLQQRDQFIHNTMGSYLSEEVLEEVLQQKTDIRIGGERRVVTILFSDIRKSTELSENMNPVDFINMLNHYLGEMIEIINSWQGNILSFVGDAIVVVFGAPKPNKEAARDAVASAVAMQRRMDAVNIWNADHGFPELAMGIGIHTGEAILGNIGSETRTKYDMIGRNVNLASRIEGFSKGGQILISAETLHAAGDQLILNHQGEQWVRPKGIQEDVQLYEVIGFGSYMLPGWRADDDQQND